MNIKVVEGQPTPVVQGPLALPTLEQLVDVPVMRVSFDRQAIQRHGLRVGQVAHEIERAFAGEEVSQVLEGRNAFGLVVRVSEQGQFGEEDNHPASYR